MLGRFFILATTIAILQPARAARAENCVDKRKLGPGDPGRPCLDIAAAYGRIETFAGPGRTGLRIDARVTGPFIVLLGNGRTVDDPGPHAGIGIDSGVWESINFGDGEYRFVHAAGLRYRRDRDDFGYYLGGYAAARWPDHYRLVTPYLGLRVGRFDRAALIAEARLAGLFLYSRCDACRSLTRDYDLTLRSTLVMKPYLRLEARGRARNLTVAEGMRQTDLFFAVGVEGAVVGKHGFRVMPTFLGVGVRYVAGHDEWKYHPMHERNEYLAVEEPGFEILVLLDVDSTIASSGRVW